MGILLTFFLAATKLDWWVLLSRLWWFWCMISSVVCNSTETGENVGGLSTMSQPLHFRKASFRPYLQWSLLSSSRASRNSITVKSWPALTWWRCFGKAAHPRLQLRKRNLPPVARNSFLQLRRKSLDNPFWIGSVAAAMIPVPSIFAFDYAFWDSKVSAVRSWRLLTSHSTSETKNPCENSTDQSNAIHGLPFVSFHRRPDTTPRNSCGISAWPTSTRELRNQFLVVLAIFISWNTAT